MNHIFCAIGAFVRLEVLRTQNVIGNWYQIQRDLFMDVIKQFILKGGFQPSLKESHKDTQTQKSLNSEKQNSHDGYAFFHRVFSKFSIYEKSETFV